MAAAKPIESAVLNAYDATGRKIGRVLDLDRTGTPLTEARVAVRVNGTVVVLNVTHNALDTFGPPLVLATTDCTRTAYLVPQDGELLEVGATVAAPGLTIYAQQPGALEQVITIKSHRRTGDCVSDEDNPGVTAFPTASLFDLSTVYTPPFVVR